jgi:hypothetical protein
MGKRGKPRIGIPKLILVAENYETGAYGAPGELSWKKQDS